MVFCSVPDDLNQSQGVNEEFERSIGMVLLKSSEDFYFNKIILISMQHTGPHQPQLYAKTTGSKN